MRVPKSQPDREPDPDHANVQQPKPAANSLVYNVTTFGVTLFTLHPHSYRWQFYREPAAGNGTLTDSGSAPCNPSLLDDNNPTG